MFAVKIMARTPQLDTLLLFHQTCSGHRCFGTSSHRVAVGSALLPLRDVLDTSDTQCPSKCCSKPAVLPLGRPHSVSCTTSQPFQPTKKQVSVDSWKKLRKGPSNQPSWWSWPLDFHPNTTALEYNCLPDQFKIPCHRE